MYFSQFPHIYYDLNKDGNPTKALHILKRVDFFQHVKDRATLYLTHHIKEGDTPELVSYKAYGSSFYHWIIIMINERLNPYFDWPMDYKNFNAYLATKYPTSKSLIFTADGTDHYAVGETVTGGTSNATGTVTKWFPTLRQLVVTVASGTFASNETITGGTSNAVRTTIASGGTVNYVDAPHHYLDSNSKEVNISASPAPTAVTNREYEDNLNEANRSIKILSPQFVPQVVEECKKLLLT